MSETIDLNTPPPQVTPEELNRLKNQVPVAKIVEKMTPQIEQLNLSNAANDRAAREPLPGITTELFNSGNIIVTTSFGEVQVRKQKALDITIFKLSNSPFYKLFMGDIQNDGKKDIQQIFPDEELLFALIYQFTHPVGDIYKMIKKDVNAYKELVTFEIGETYTQGDVLIVVNAIMAHIGLVTQARVEFESGDEDKKKSIFIDKPQGFGWLTDYIIRLHKEYGYSIEYIMVDLDMLDGWMLYSYAYANDPIHRFGGIKMRTSPSSMEADKLLNEIKKYYNK